MSVRIAREDHLGIITLDRAPANTFDEIQTEALADAVTAMGEDPEVRVVLIRSARRIFCRGVDIAMVESWNAKAYRNARLRRFGARLQEVFAGIEALPKPSMAAISGAATGGGLELALACDFRVAETTVELGLPQVELGLLPGAGGTQRLTRLVGPSIAHRLVLGAELVTGREAEQLGIVHWATEDDAETVARAHLDRLAQLPPAAYAAAKRCIAAAQGDDGFSRELDEIGRLITTPDTARRLEGFVAHAR